MMDWGAYFINLSVIIAFIILGLSGTYFKYRNGLVHKLNIVVVMVIFAVATAVNYVVWNYHLKNVILACTIMTVVILPPLVWYTKRTLINPVKNLGATLKALAEGDLTVTPNNYSTKEFEEMGEQTKKLTQNFREILGGVSQVAKTNAQISKNLSERSDEVNNSIKQVATTVEEVAKGGQNLSESVSQTKIKTDQLIESINSVAKNASQSSQEAENTRDESTKGGESAKIAGESMKRISDVVNTSASVVSDLGQKSTKISDVIDVINAISEQTNLLALNAAIEAARAGDAGRGFAVVADEVRKLAEESQKATKQIGDMIQQIVATTQEAVSAMSSGKIEVDKGSDVVREALKSLEIIGQKVSSVAKNVKHINEQTSSQLENSGVVQQSITTFSTLAEQSAAASQEVSATVQETTAAMDRITSLTTELNQGTQKLADIMGGFKLD